MLWLWLHSGQNPINWMSDNLEKAHYLPKHSSFCTTRSWWFSLPPFSHLLFQTLSKLLWNVPRSACFLTKHTKENTGISSVLGLGRFTSGLLFCWIYMRFWYAAFSKFYEFVDTWIILYKGGRPSTLQVFHHIGAVITMWTAVASRCPCTWVFVIFNAFVSLSGLIY